MAKRKQLSKKIRFEVFKRDSFTCQYCGRSAPEVILQVDHIKPVSGGGTNDLINLVTSCVDCNLGKGDRKLDDKSIVAKQIDQMKAINERQEQLAMMAEWRNSLLTIEENSVNVLAEYINRIILESGREISDSYRHQLKVLVKKYPIDDIYLAIDKAEDTYLKDKSEESIEKFLTYIPRICYWQKVQRENPTIAEINKIIAIANKIWWRCNRSELFRQILNYHEKHGVPLETIKANVAAASGIMKFNEYMSEVIDV